MVRLLSFVRWLQVHSPSSCTLHLTFVRLCRYHIVSGAKIFYVLPPTKENLRKFEDWSCSPSQVGSTSRFTSVHSGMMLACLFQPIVFSQQCEMTRLIDSALNSLSALCFVAAVGVVLSRCCARPVHAGSPAGRRHLFDSTRL